MIRRFRPTTSFANGVRRVATSFPDIMQLVLAAAVGYSIAHFGLGHAIPFLAVTVCISSLGLTRDARPRRVLDTALGITFGVLLANVSLVLVGRGVWQLLIVMMLVMMLARLVHPSPGFAVSAGIQASLVQLIPVAGGDEFTRVVDASIGAAVALAASALIPRNARKLAIRDEERMVHSLGEAFELLQHAAHEGDQESAQDALRILRGLDSLIREWSADLDGARSIAKVSPLARRHRADISTREARFDAIELATRNARVVARRISHLTADGEPRLQLAETLGSISSGIAELSLGLKDERFMLQARQSFTLALQRLGTRFALADAHLRDATVFMQCRPLLVDLLRATGLTYEEARAALPDVTDGP